ncbi:MAG: thioether cross-link-forming SCIFF peptide maturase, partial [Clostridia bacterium]|nr:thioether cross-link-forming SCIFF peptide maturase [Clostridia bacterium]
LDCWARLWCAGGCAANAYHATGSVSGVYESGCDLFRKRLECAVMMKIASGDTLSSADCDGCEGCS